MSSFFKDISPSCPSNANLALYCSTSGSGSALGGGGGGGGGGTAALVGAGVRCAVLAEGTEDGGGLAATGADFPGKGCAAGFGRAAAPGFF